MKEFQKELMKAIEEVATSTDITVDKCIVQAMEMLREEEDENMGND